MPDQETSWIDDTVDPATMAVPSTRIICGWLDARPTGKDPRRRLPDDEELVLIYSGTVREDVYNFPAFYLDPDHWHLVRSNHDEEEDTLVFTYLDGTRFEGTINYFISVGQFNASPLRAVNWREILKKDNG